MHISLSWGSITSASIRTQYIGDRPLSVDIPRIEIADQNENNPGPKPTAKLMALFRMGTTGPCNR